MNERGALFYLCIMQLTSAHYKRLITIPVQVGGITIGANNPIRIQTMTTTDTLDTKATVAQSIRCIEAGAELIRITAPSKKEAENLAAIKKEIRAAGFNTPIIADIHYTPNAAEIAARIIEKVRINPGNYIDKKKFNFIEYTDAEYAEEIDNIRERFLPLVKICKEHGTAMRIGTNHGSLSDRIMSRYGDTPMGMVESAMEFLRIARDEAYNQIILSMKSSNPQVMVQAYRLLVEQMEHEFGMCYPLHLGVTEAGDGEDGRIKSAIGIGTLLEEGIGDTIRVSLTEDPEFEIPVCKDIVQRFTNRGSALYLPAKELFNHKYPYSRFEHKRRESVPASNIGTGNVPVVVADLSKYENITPSDLTAIGYKYDAVADKYAIADGAADFVYTGGKIIDFGLPGTLQNIVDADVFNATANNSQLVPYLKHNDLAPNRLSEKVVAFVEITTDDIKGETIAYLKQNSGCVAVIKPASDSDLNSTRLFIHSLIEAGIKNPLVLYSESAKPSIDEELIQFATTTGGLFLDGIGDGIWLNNCHAKIDNHKMNGRTYLEVHNNEQFLNNTCFSILQATRTRISKTEYISCPSCGRTLFELQETTAKIRKATHHLKGVKIAIMGCIVNGPGEMADADFGYVGSGPGKITLYKSKEVVRKNIPAEGAVDELIDLLKENGVWIENATN